MSRYFIVCVASLLLSPQDVLAAEPTRGPEKGTLVVVGGGDRDRVVFKRFVELAGGKAAKVVFVPTASSSKPDYNYLQSASVVYAREELKMPNVTVVHTHDRAEADTEAFVEPIRAADAIWFSGGRQWRIADAYLGTLAEREFRGVLNRGGVIGGSSAGASIQASFLVRGDTSGSNVLIGDHQHGLGYIKNCAIDQHVIPRKRQLGLIEVLSDPDDRMNGSIDRESLLGLGIDEATGIVVRGNEFEVIGKEDGVVLVYNPETWTSRTDDRDKYVTLWNGAKYNMKDRVVLNGGTPPHSQVTKRPEGYYKDIFMDGGVSLTSRTRLPAAESLGMSYEHYAGKDAAKQRALIVGNSDDTNGVLLYPDGQPRFRLLYVNGGAARKHGVSLSKLGRTIVTEFYNNGGSYCGSCAGAFLSGINVDGKSGPREGYLLLFPYNTLNTGLKKARVGHHIPQGSALLKYNDFGGDSYVGDIYHNGGNWLSPKLLKDMKDVEVLATYDAPDKKVHEGAAIWAWKKDNNAGRVVNIGSHPEGVTKGERLSLTAACFQHAVAGIGRPDVDVKARLEPGVVHRMDRDTADKDPLHTKIGDRQCHHFTFDVKPNATNVQIEISGQDDFQLNMFLRPDSPAFRSNAVHRNVQSGSDKRISETLAPGRWFVSVECETTVDAMLDETRSFFRYRGNTDVLNGVAYEISLTTQ